MTIEIKALAKVAIAAQKNAYCPYSHFAVGSAILTEGGQVFGGCNVETAHYKGICAEGSAISAMVTSGETSIRVIVVVGPKDDEACTPCGDCRQRIAEFANPDTKIFVVNGKEDLLREYTLADLLPDAFTPPPKK